MVTLILHFTNISGLLLYNSKFVGRGPSEGLSPRGPGNTTCWNTHKDFFCNAVFRCRTSPSGNLHALENWSKIKRRPEQTPRQKTGDLFYRDDREMTELTFSGEARDEDPLLVAGPRFAAKRAARTCVTVRVVDTCSIGASFSSYSVKIISGSSIMPQFNKYARHPIFK